jgi:Flp pilus assembly protein TadB
VRNPLRSEAEAFRFLIAVIIAALVIVGAAYLNTWLGVAAAVLAVAGIIWWLRSEPGRDVSDV